MKIRRILATAVAAAVTTPAVFLSAAPAFADTPGVPNPKLSAQDAQDAPGDDEPGEGDYAEYEKLIAAVADAEKKVKDLKAKRKALVQALKDDTFDVTAKTKLAEAKAADEAATAAITAADAALVKAEADLAKLKEPGSTATPEEITAAEGVVATAKTAVEGANAVGTGTQLRLEEAQSDYTDARDAQTRKISDVDAELAVAQQDLIDAQDALEEFENGDFEECVEDPNIKVDLTGPKSVTAGKSGVFSMRVSNTSDHDLNEVGAYAGGLRLLAGDEDGTEVPEEDEEDFLKRLIDVEWSTTESPKWQKFSEEEGPVDLGTLKNGASKDVKLRFTVEKDAPAGHGMAFAVGVYEIENPDDSACGEGESFASVDFDILAAEDEKPTTEPTEEPSEEPTAEPTPSPSTTTPTPAPTATTGNTNTTAQGGTTKGALAATGANDSTLPIGLAAAGAVVLGAGAMVLTRRRKAGTDA